MWARWMVGRSPPAVWVKRPLSPAFSSAGETVLPCARNLVWSFQSSLCPVKSLKSARTIVFAAGSTGLIGCVALAVALLASWLHHGLLLPKALPGPGRLVEAYALTLSITGVSLISLSMVAILWALEARDDAA